MRKLKYVIAILSISSAAFSGDTVVYPTIPGTNLRDYSQPGVRYEGNSAYPTIPGTTLRDYSMPGWTVGEE